MNSKKSTEQSAIYITGKVDHLNVIHTEKLKVPMATFCIRGEKGVVPAIIFPQKYAEYGELIKTGNELNFACEFMDDRLGDQKYQLTAASILDQGGLA
jgi:DNA polymerase III alpha subunit